MTSVRLVMVEDGQAWLECQACGAREIRYRLEEYDWPQEGDLIAPERFERKDGQEIIPETKMECPACGRGWVFAHSGTDPRKEEARR